MGLVFGSQSTQNTDNSIKQEAQGNATFNNTLDMKNLGEDAARAMGEGIGEGNQIGAVKADIARAEYAKTDTYGTKGSKFMDGLNRAANICDGILFGSKPEPLPATTPPTPAAGLAKAADNARANKAASVEKSSDEFSK